MPKPRPGTLVRGSKTGKAIMVLLDLLGRTWALAIIWHLHTDSVPFQSCNSAVIKGHLPC